MDRFVELARAPRATLDRSFRAGRGPALASLVGFEWRGYNTSRVTRLLGIQKFIKGFFETSAVEGYNIPVVQNGLFAPWIDKPHPSNPRRYAFYLVKPGDEDSPDKDHAGAALLDYGASTRNPRLAIPRLLRDYLVQVDEANPDLLLGKAYLVVGGLRIPASYFVLERLRSVSWTP